MGRTTLTRHARDGWGGEDVRSPILEIEERVGPPAELVYRRPLQLGAFARELWAARSLIRALVERELRVRYKQAVLGFGWAIIPPLVTVVVFTFVFRRVVEIDTEGAPYVLFSFLGMLPWAVFASSMTSGGASLVNNAVLLNKISCPREIFVITQISVAAFDMIVSVVPVLLLFLLTGTTLHLEVLAALPLLLVVLAFTTGVTLVVAASLVFLRDIRHALPLLTQLGLFATPVFFGLEEVPRRFRGVYVGLNPIAGAIDGLRRGALEGRLPSLALSLVATGSAVVALVVGYLVFKRLEPGIADVA